MSPAPFARYREGGYGEDPAWMPSNGLTGTAVLSCLTEQAARHLNQVR